MWPRYRLFLAAALEGLADGIEILRGLTGMDPSLSVALDGLRSAVREGPAGIEKIGRLRLAAYFIAQLKQAQRWQAGIGDERTYWALKLAAELQNWADVIDRYLRWMEVLSQASDDALLTLGPSFAELRRGGSSGYSVAQRSFERNASAFSGFAGEAQHS